MTVHFVYSKGDRICTPDAITNELESRLSKCYDLKVYDWMEKGTIVPHKHDILIGHPALLRNTIFRNSFWQAGWSKRIVMIPFHHATMLREMSFLDPLITHADHLLAICGKYWTDTMAETITSHWQYKTIQLDLAVNTINFPFIKKSFSRPGQRKFLYIGHTAPYKGCDYLSELADANLNLQFGWIGSGDMPSKSIVAHGRQDFSNRLALDLVSEYDFLIACGRSDANPTVILEAAAWGLIPVCTPQSGYYKEEWLVNIPLDNVEVASEILNHLNNLSDSELMLYQHKASRVIQSHYNWDRMAKQVVGCIEAPVPKVPNDPYKLRISKKNRRIFTALRLQNETFNLSAEILEKAQKITRKLVKS